MIDYVYQPDTPYSAFLEAGGHSLGLSAPVEPREDELVGSPGTSSLAEVQMEIQEWHTGVEGVDGPFHWGSCECLLARGQYAAPVEALKRASRTHAQRWAVEQYDLARSAFTAGRFAESLDTAIACLNGREKQPGDKTDYRGHFLVGMIRLGNFHHRSPELLDLEAAEQSFACAGRYAAELQPTDAAWAHLASAWAAYCRGAMDHALGQVRLALTLRSKFGEAQYLGAKMMFRQKQYDAGIGFLAAAVAVHPSFAGRAIRDRDFAGGEAKVDQVIEVERLRANERAGAALKIAVKRAVEIGILKPDERTPVALPPGTGAGRAAAMIVMALELMPHDTLYTYVEADALAARANETLTAAIGQSKTDKRALEQTVRAVQRAIVQLLDFKDGTTKLGDHPLKEVRKAQALIAAAEPALATNDLCEFLKLHDAARIALAAAIKALEDSKRIAIEETLAKHQEVEEQLGKAAASDGPWGKYVTKGAMIGFAVALVPTLFMTVFTGSSPLEGSIGSLFRFMIIALGASGVGALIGALAGPLGDFNATAERMNLETAKTELAEAIDELKAVPLGNSTV